MVSIKCCDQGTRAVQGLEELAVGTAWRRAMNLRPFGRSARRGATVVGATLLGSLALVAGSQRAHEHASAWPQAPRSISEALGLTAPGAGTASQPGAWDLTAIGHERIDYWIGRFQTDKRED